MGMLVLMGSLELGYLLTAAAVVPFPLGPAHTAAVRIGSQAHSPDTGDPVIRRGGQRHGAVRCTKDQGRH